MAITNMMQANTVCRSVSYGVDKGTGLKLDLKMLLVLDFFPLYIN